MPCKSRSRLKILGTSRTCSTTCGTWNPRSVDRSSHKSAPAELAMACRSHAPLPCLSPRVNHAHDHGRCWCTTEDKHVTAGLKVCSDEWMLRGVSNGRLLPSVPTLPLGYSAALEISSRELVGRVKRSTHQTCTIEIRAGLSQSRWARISTHHSLLALNSFPSFLQCILLALSSLLFLRAPPGPELFFLPFLAPLALSLLSLTPPEPLLLSLALPEPSILLAPPALSSSLAPPALSSALTGKTFPLTSGFWNSCWNLLRIQRSRQDRFQEERVGPGVRIPQLLALYKTNRRWKLPEQSDALDYLEAAVEGDPEWRRNYSTLAELSEQVTAVLEDLAERGQVLSEQEARKKYPHLVIASLGRIRDQEPRSLRTSREHCARNRRRARRTLRSDWYLLGCQIQPGGTVYVNKVGTFGVASASYYWSPVASATSRLAQYLVGHASLTWHMLVADDLLLVASGPCYRAALVIFLLLCSSLNVPLSWNKTAGGDTVTWVRRTPRWVDSKRVSEGSYMLQAHWNPSDHFLVMQCTAQDTWHWSS